ncbi:MAG: hypothetical protein JEY94_12095 [Melioribacteraceae bacterium]|nr:hypothetical protein [Melioribacteraceae bacterium]
MQITEKDLFDFIFHRATLEWPKIKFILNDKFLLNYIQFYKNLKKELNLPEISNDVKIKLFQKIPSYKLESQYILTPLQGNANKRIDYIDDELHLNLYSSSNNEFFAKEFREKDGARLYLFSVHFSQIQNLDVIMKPSNDKFHLVNNSKSLYIENFNRFDHLEVKFNYSL